MTGMTGPLTDIQLSALEASETEVSGRFAVTHGNTRQLMDGLDLWEVKNISTTELEVVNLLTVAVAKMFRQAANAIHEIVAERDSENNGSNDLPPVLPHQLVKIDMRELSKIISEHNPRLIKRLCSIEIHQIGKDFVDLLRSYREEKCFNRAEEDCTDSMTDFSAGWKVTNGRFRELRRFCGDLASAIPNTATVESDFSIIGWEKDDFRKRITYFSLQGILHCKQFARLRSLRSMFS
jgi:hypothetical protein